MKRGIQILIFFFSSLSICAQIGGDYVYGFLHLPSSARETGLGGTLISVADEDLSLANANPALLNEKMHNRLIINHNLLFADISNGYAAYAYKLKPLDLMVHGGIKYINYGKFDLADEFGNIAGDFKANELAFHLGSSKSLNKRFKIGLNIKLIRSQLSGFNSTGIASDIGVLYQVEESQLAVGLSLKNAGGEVSTYRNSKGIAPIDLQLGISKKLQYLPFRFNLTFHSLQRWRLRYDSPLNLETDIFGNIIESGKMAKEIDNFFRHVIFSGELLIGKTQNVRIRIGYNHQRRKELAVSSFRSLGGFSFGFGIKISKFRLDYGVGNYHLAGAVNHIGLNIDLDSIFKKEI